VLLERRSYTKDCCLIGDLSMLDWLTAYKRRIARPADLIKQPAQDILRLISAGIFYLAKKKFQADEKVSIKSKRISRILVIRRNRLGDAVSVLPSLQALVDCHPSLKIDVLATNYNAIIFSRSPVINAVYEIPDKGFFRNYLVYFHPLISSLRSCKYDAVVVASGAYSSHGAWLGWAVRGRIRAGVISSRGSLLNLVYNVPVSVDGLSQYNHQVQKIAGIFVAANLLEVAANLPTPRIFIKKGRLSSHQDLICLCPDAQREMSTWPDRSWLELSNLFEARNINHFFLGSSLPRFAEKDFRQSTTTEDFIEIMAEATLVVCSEGGASHISAALGKPVIVLSGKGIKDLWAPWTSKSVLIEKPGKIKEIRPSQVLKQTECWIRSGTFAHDEDTFLAAAWMR